MLSRGFSIFLMLFTLTGSVRAVPAFAAPGAFEQIIARNPVYARLSSDLGTEVLDFDEFQTPVLRKKARSFSKAWKAFLADPLHAPDPLDKTSLPDIPKVSGLPEGDSQAELHESTLENVAVDPILGSESHSMENISTYVRNRLGEEAAALIHSGKVKPVVYAGTEKSALEQFSDAVRIPSVYEKWGVSKFLRPDDELIYVIPPIREYAEHFGDMIELAGGKPEILMNGADRAAELTELSTISSRIVAELGGSPDYVVLGYSKNWAAIFGEAAKKWTVEMDGVTGTLYKVKLGGLDSRVMTFSSSRTLWGEASAALVHGMLPSKPRAVLFMGSSGGISERTSLYARGVPSEFRDRAGRKIPILNLFYRHGSDPAIVHGNTASPAAESMPQVDRWLSQGIDSVDVEQSLVAAEIANYNDVTSSRIRFGAADLITDLPASTKLGRRAEEDLDHVDWAQKAKARGGIVRFALDSISEDRQAWQFSGCEKLLLPLGAKP